MNSSRVRALVLPSVAACCACASALPLRLPETVHVKRLLRGGYVVIDDDTGREIPERDFARMYKARTGSSELDVVDHPHVTTTAVGLTVGGLMLGGGSAAATDGAVRHDGNVTTVGAIVGILGTVVLTFTTLHALAGAPEEHDVPRDRIEPLVQRYNDMRARSEP